MQNKMEKNRMKKLAGINEGTAFKNGKFELPRFDVWATSFGDIADELSPDGEWCAADEVAKLEAIAAEMYGIVNHLADIFYGADARSFGSPASETIRHQAEVLAKQARDVIKKSKSL